MKLALLLALTLACHSTPAAEPGPEPTAVDVAIVRGRVVVEMFFGEPLGPFADQRFAHRAELAAFAKATWGVPELPCWAVAMASGSTLVTLDPAVWPTEACDHADADDLPEVVAHELVHVFHGQHRPDDVELNNAADVEWFVEGLAVYAADQLDDERRAQIETAEKPARLAEAWSGPARYGIAGTLVELIDRRLGRAGLIALLPVSTTAEILAALGLTEEEFLALLG